MKKLNQPQFNSNQSSLLVPKLSKFLAVGIVSSILAISSSEAVLRVTFDMRAVQSGVVPGTTSSGLVAVSPDGRSAQISSGSSSIVLQLVATLAATDVDLTNDSFTRGDGSFITSATVGDLAGGMRSDTLTTAGVNNLDPFKGTGAKSGKNTVNLSGTNNAGGIAFPGPVDSILDIGGTSVTAFTDYFTSSANTPTGAVGQSFILGETVLNLNGSTGSTVVSFVPRLATAGLTGNKATFTFKIDGVSFQFRGDGALATQAGGAGDATSFVFNPVTLTVVPEPSAFGMVLLGGLGLIGFRRMGLRQS